MEHRHHARTVRLLETRLEALAAACERSRAAERQLHLAVAHAEAATRHAVKLEILTVEEATVIWAEVAGRHPGVGWCRSGPRLAA
jgi:hypothetical protein